MTKPIKVLRNGVWVDLAADNARLKAIAESKAAQRERDIKAFREVQEKFRDDKIMTACNNFIGKFLEGQI